MVSGMSDDGSLKLGAVVGRLTMLEIACALRAAWAATARQADRPVRAGAAAALAGDCPKRRSSSIYDKCRVHFPQLPALFMRK
jgi:hypothetical protein